MQLRINTAPNPSTCRCSNQFLLSPAGSQCDLCMGIIPQGEEMERREDATRFDVDYFEALESHLVSVETAIQLDPRRAA